MRRWTDRVVNEGGRGWRDIVSDDARFRIAEGYDEPARRAGKPWSLFDRTAWKGSYASIGEARREAERIAEGRPKSRQRSAG